MSYFQNGDKFYYSIVVTNNSSYTDTNVTTVIDALPAGIAYDHVTHTQGTYNSGTRTWFIASMPGKTTTTLKFWVTVTDVGLGPFTITGDTTGTLVDPNLVDNTFSLTANASECTPDAGGVNDTTSCLCINVATNDTPCTYGVTEYRLDELSIVNGTLQYWDELTGIGGFTPIDPTLPITGTYDLWCVLGVDEYQKSCGVTFTIYPQLEDKDIFDHTINTVEYGDLSVDDLAVLAAQYPALTLADYCWRVLRNADGDATSGEPVDCNDTQDTRTIHLCSAVDCEDIVNNCPLCPQNQLPADIQILLDAIILADEYEVQLGDTIVVQHPNATSTYVYGALGWERNDCGCVYKICQDADNDLVLGTDDAPYIDVSGLAEIEALADKVVTGIAFTGTGTKTLTLTFDDATTLTANFTDISGSADTVVQVSDSCSINFAISGVGTLLDPYIVTGTVNDGSPTFIYAPGTPGSTGNTLDVSTLFGMACPGGCTATYTLNGYPADVYDAGTIDLTGVTLTYDILITAPPGTHDINIQRTCA